MSNLTNINRQNTWYHTCTHPSADWTLLLWNSFHAWPSSMCLSKCVCGTCMCAHARFTCTTGYHCDGFTTWRLYKNMLIGHERVYKCYLTADWVHFRDCKHIYIQIIQLNNSIEQYLTFCMFCMSFILGFSKYCKKFPVRQCGPTVNGLWGATANVTAQNYRHGMMLKS